MRLKGPRASRAAAVVPHAEVLLAPRETGSGTSYLHRLCYKMDQPNNGKTILRQASKHLEREIPYAVARVLRRLRHPDARWIRAPVGLILLIGGIFSFLPILGIWMLPLGLLLMAYDVPLLRKPVARFTFWGLRKWTSIRQISQRRG